LLIAAAYAVFFFAGISPDSFRADDLRLKAILELPEHDYVLTISPEAVIEECSAALAKKEKRADAVTAEYHLRRAQAQEALGNAEEALADADVALKLAPGWKAGRFEHAACLCQLGRLTEGMRELGELVHDHPDYAAAHAALAACQLRLGQRLLSIDSATKAINCDKEYYLPYRLRGQALLGLGRHQPALEDFNRAIELSPLPGRYQQEATYCLRGMALSALGKHRAALSNHQMALRLNAGSFPAEHGVCQVYYDVCRYHLACFAAGKLTRRYKDKPEALLLHARCLNAIDRPREALRVAEEALQLDPRNPAALAELGIAREKIGQYDAAKESYDEALRLAPNNLHALCAKAAFLASCPKDEFRDGKKALELAGKAYEGAPSVAVLPSLALTMAQAEAGDFVAATATAEKCLKMLRENEGSTEQIDNIVKAFKQKRPVRRTAFKDNGP
jgi:tetratricopeptide (TPR) repeat protein